MYKRYNYVDIILTYNYHLSIFASVIELVEKQGTTESR